jgi:hypothetical protein
MKKKQAAKIPSLAECILSHDMIPKPHYNFDHVTAEGEKCEIRSIAIRKENEGENNHLKSQNISKSVQAIIKYCTRQNSLSKSIVIRAFGFKLTCLCMLNSMHSQERMKDYLSIDYDGMNRVLRLDTLVQVNL